MKADRWQKIEELFGAALECAPEERLAFVAKASGSDETLRREVETLLASHRQAGDFIQAPAFQEALNVMNVSQSALERGHRLGRYEIIREIGHGGMGTVYLAARADDEFKKRVAIKLIKRGMDTDDILRRFRNERQILASLDHPNIARLLDGGTSEDGLSYFVMEYVEGLPLLTYSDTEQLSTTERLKLFRKICAAVQHAHQNLIVHRDLKPSNILVTAMGEPKLLDFGIAKLLNPEMSPQTIAPTATGMRLMTREYASPEQVRGGHITTASDIYSLGVILYELLTGQRPYNLKNTSPEEMVRVICDSEPSKPSEAIRNQLSALKAEQENEEQKANIKAKLQNPKVLQGDLDNIVLMALRKESSRRYKSVEQLSEDIERHLTGKPILARKDTVAYRASKFITRNRVAVTAAAVVLLAIIAGLIGTIWQASVARRERDVARAAQAKAERINEFLSAALSYSDPSAAIAGAKNHRDATINQMLDDIAPRIEAELADQPEIRASIERTVGLAYASQVRISEAEHYLNVALETQVKIYGEEHQETAHTLLGLVSVQGAKGDYAGAEKSLQKIIAIYHKQPPKEQTAMKVFITALINVGDVKWVMGDYRAADSAYSEALTVASQLQNQDRESVADAKAGLGRSRYAQGKLEEAVSLLQEAVNDYRSLPRLRVKLPDALNFLAQVLIWKKESDNALSVLQESEAISLEVWGENNGFYPRSLWLRAYALCFKGEYKEAEKTLDKSEAIYNRNFPSDKIIRGNLFDARNLVFTHTGREQQGETFGRQAVELYKSSTNRGSASMTLSRLHLGENLITQKKFDQAEQLLLEAYKDASEIQGADHWRTKEVARELVKLYESRNKPELAENFRAKIR